MLMIFAVFIQPLKSISYWMCFHNCGRLWNHLHWLTGITIFAPVGPLSSWQQRLSWIESTFYLYRIDFDEVSKRLQFVPSWLVPKWPNSKDRNGTFIHWFINFIYLLVLDHWLGTKSQNPPPSHNLKIWNASTNCTSRLFQFVQKGENFGRWGTVVVLLWLKLSTAEGSPEKYFALNNRNKVYLVKINICVCCSLSIC